jgi:hypothetical protein
VFAPVPGNLNKNANILFTVVWFIFNLEKTIHLLNVFYNTQCCGSSPFWYGSGSCLSLLYGPGSCFSMWYISGSRLFDTDPEVDPYCFKEVMYVYLKRYFLYIFTRFSLSVGPTGPTQKVFFVKFSLPANFVVLIRVGSLWIRGTPGERIRILKNYTDPHESGSTTLIVQRVHETRRIFIETQLFYKTKTMKNSTYIFLKC